MNKKVKIKTPTKADYANEVPLKINMSFGAFVEKMLQPKSDDIICQVKAKNIGEIKK